MEPNQPQPPQVPVQDDIPQQQVPEQMVERPLALPEVEPVNWQGVEYLQHNKTPLWYVGFVAAVLILMTGAVLVQAWTFVALIPVMAVALMVYSHRPPRQIQYSVSEHGLHINDQLHPLGEFKAFGVMQEHGTNALVLIPVKRFRPNLVVYFPPETGEALVDTLGAFIPMQEVRPDFFDKIIGKLRI